MFAKQQHKHKSIYTTSTTPITFSILSHQLLFPQSSCLDSLLKQQNKYICWSLYPLLIKLMGPSITWGTLGISVRKAGLCLHLVQTWGAMAWQGNYRVYVFFLPFPTDDLSFPSIYWVWSFSPHTCWGETQQVCFYLQRPCSHSLDSVFTIIPNPDQSLPPFLICACINFILIQSLREHSITLIVHIDFIFHNIWIEILWTDWKKEGVVVFEGLNPLLSEWNWSRSVVERCLE